MCLRFQFAPFKESVFFIFLKKKSNSLYPTAHIPWWLTMFACLPCWLQVYPAEVLWSKTEIIWTNAANIVKIGCCLFSLSSVSGGCSCLLLVVECRLSSADGWFSGVVVGVCCWFRLLGVGCCLSLSVVAQFFHCPCLVLRYSACRESFRTIPRKWW